MSEIDSTSLREILTELVMQTSRIARAIENNPKTSAGRIATSVTRHADTNRLDEMRLQLQNQLQEHARNSEKPSWHQNLRRKRVSLPAATGTSIVIYAVAEIARIVIGGYFH